MPVVHLSVRSSHDEVEATPVATDATAEAPATDATATPEKKD